MLLITNICQFIYNTVLLNALVPQSVGTYTTVQTGRAKILYQIVLLLCFKNPTYLLESLTVFLNSQVRYTEIPNDLNVPDMVSLLTLSAVNHTHIHVFGSV